MLTTDRERPCKMLVAGLLAAMVMGFAGCQKPAPAPEVLFKAAARPADYPPSPALAARVYLDATASMDGFARAGAESQYVQYLGDLDLALKRAWSNSTVEYYRFGSVAERLPGTSAYRAAGEVDFYHGGANFLETRIDRAIDEASPSVLTLVVTDLYQEDADVSALLQHITTRVTAHRLALAVLGVKAEFNGTVYDVGYSHMKFPWNSQGDAKRRHPFYTVMVGRTADIVRLADQLKAVSQIVRMENLVIMAPAVVSSPLDWRAVEVTRQIGIGQDARVVDGGKRGALAFLTNRNTDLEFDASLSYNPVPYAPAIRFSKLHPPSTLVRLWSRPNFWTAAASRDVAPGPKPEAFRLEKDGEKVTLRGRIPAKSLPSNGTYAFALNQELNFDDYELPAFCTAWTLTNADIALYAQKPEAFDGSRTQNLSQFVNGVWTIMLHEYQPTLGTIYVYVRR